MRDLTRAEIARTACSGKCSVSRCVAKASAIVSSLPKTIRSNSRITAWPRSWSITCSVRSAAKTETGTRSDVSSVAVDLDACFLRRGNRTTGNVQAGEDNILNPVRVVLAAQEARARFGEADVGAGDFQRVIRGSV